MFQTIFADSDPLLLFVTALIITTKFLRDSGTEFYYGISTWEELSQGRYTKQQLTEKEMRICNLLYWKLCIDSNDLKRFEAEVFAAHNGIGTQGADDDENTKAGSHKVCDWWKRVASGAPDVSKPDVFPSSPLFYLMEFMKQRRMAGLGVHPQSGNTTAAASSSSSQSFQHHNSSHLPSPSSSNLSQPSNASSERRRDRIRQRQLGPVSRPAGKQPASCPSRPAAAVQTQKPPARHPLFFLNCELLRSCKPLRRLEKVIEEENAAEKMRISEKVERWRQEVVEGSSEEDGLVSLERSLSQVSAVA
jgi:hypothetical protein